MVLHEPKDAAAIARAIKQEGRQDRGVTHEFISKEHYFYYLQREVGRYLMALTRLFPQTSVIKSTFSFL